MTGVLTRSPIARPLGFALAALVSLAVAQTVAAEPLLLRPLLAVLIGGTLFVLSTLSPAGAVVAAVCFLPFLGLIRRLLIPVAGWSASDPLLLVAPALAVALAARLFVLERRAITTDRISTLVAALLALALLQAFNPLGGSPTAGLTGLLFVATPFVWFFVGREFVDRRAIGAIVGSLVVIAPLAACYGIAQTQSGFPSWDAAWVDANGYAALSVGGRTRPFGTFASSAEYATYLTAAAVAATAFVLTRRAWVLPVIPVVAVAVFLASSRGIVVIGVLACLVVAGLRSGRPRLAVGLVACGLVAALLAAKFVHAPARADAHANTLVAHQVGGLADPLDSDESTLRLHWNALLHGFAEGVRNPLGWGTGSTNLASNKHGGAEKGTEIDVSDAFVALGLPGGVLFIALILTTLRRAFALALRRRDTVTLAVAGVVVVALGQWLNGGYYSVAPVVWLAIGWLARQPVDEEAA